MKTYKIGDKISINLAPNEAIPAGMYLVATFYNEDTRDVYEYSTEDGAISKISDTLYNVTITPRKCMEMGLGIYRLELGLYTPNRTYVNISINDVCFTIVESATGRQILG